MNELAKSGILAKFLGNPVIFWQMHFEDVIFTELNKDVMDFNNYQGRHEE